jgi:hypothetical protein
MKDTYGQLTSTEARDAVRALYDLIGSTTSAEQLSALNRLAYAIHPAIDAALDSSVGEELWRWAGLLRDAPQMGAEYRTVIIEAFGDLVEPKARGRSGR